MIKGLLSLTLLFVVGHQGFGQRTINPDFDRKINRMLSYDVDIITVDQVKERLNSNIKFLDAREKKEFDISHIPLATYIGYDNFNLNNVEDLSKTDTLIVYCSIGYRSEKIGQKLKKAGFANVYNLYGSIFEWANKGLPLEDEKGPTLKLHTYNQNWSKWVENKTIEKVF